MIQIKEILNNCKEAQVIGIEKEFQSIGFKKWVQLKMHIAYCSYCKNFLDQSAHINSLIQKLPQESFQETLSSEKKEQIDVEIRALLAKNKS